MFNVFKSIKASHAVVAAGATYLGYYSLWLQIKDRNNNPQTKTLQYRLNSLQLEIQNLNIKINELEAQNASLSEDNLKCLIFLKKQMDETNQIIANIKSKLESFKELAEKNTPVNDSEVLDTIDDLTSRIEDSNNIVAKAMELWRNHSNSLWNGDGISNLFDNFRTMLSQLSFEQLWSFSHIASSIFILLCLVSVISIIYSDYLLNYLKIEDKYPRLKRLINYYRKRSHIYITIEIFFCFLCLITLLILSIMILKQNS